VALALIIQSVAPERFRAQITAEILQSSPRRSNCEPAMIRRLAFLPALIVAAQMSAQPSASIGRLEKQPFDSPQRLELLQVQILLDRAGFRPGKLDGLGGEFTQAAADRLNTAKGLPPGQRLDLSAVPEPLRDYTLTEEDLNWVGQTASSPAEQEKLDRMPYADAWELVAEKFHSDLDYIREINPTVTDPVAGTILRVPDVEEFSMQLVLDLDAQRKAAAKAEKAAAEKAAAEAATPTPTPGTTELAVTPPTEPTPTPAAADESKLETRESKITTRLVILRAPRLIELYEDDRLVASFPCTPGSDRVPVPVGDWKITSNVLMPYFRYDKSVLKDGTRSDNAFNIPPGPNNYVGIVWMGINRKSVGIHGTNSPDQIGRNQSSGCIRLANWDAYYLTQRIEKGTLVQVR
jgi:lipoprotein-anchoring transpeptidase ErfK/SrfK